MPELPEVETISRDLDELVGGSRINRVDLAHPKLLLTPLDQFQGCLTGAVINKISRLGKMVHFEFSGGRHLLVHLKMTGQFGLEAWPEENEGRLVWPQHAYLAFLLADRPRNREALIYYDIRKFGRMRLLDQPEFDQYLSSGLLGQDPFGLSPERFHTLITASRGRLKGQLLDQTLMAGLGNIYADESLFASCLHPARPASSLTPAESAELLGHIKDILSRSIAARGSTTSNYQGLKGGGSYQDQHQVYGRSGRKCPRCGQTIEKTTIAGRTTSYCRQCQRVS